MKGFRKNKLLFTVTIIILIVTFIVSVFAVFHNFTAEQRAARTVDQLRTFINTDNEKDLPTVDDKYGELFAKYEYLAGWLSIAGAGIDLPVMHRSENEDYYLRRDIHGRYSVSGTPYIAEFCTLNPVSENLLIYGHNMEDGSMFAPIIGYESESFYKEHPTIQFDTRNGFGTYEIIAAYRTVAYSAEGFAYYQFSNGSDMLLNQYIETSKSLSLYDTGVSAGNGDQLITISTCEYTRKDGRFVIVAKRVNE